MSTTLLPRAGNMTYEDWLGNDNEIGLSIMRRKYVRGEESFPEWLYRVSGGDGDLARLIFEKKLLFGGRTMANRGTDSHASYFNCYSRGFVEDDYRDIMQAAVDIGMTFKAQGGQGISLTKLRPKGAPISPISCPRAVCVPRMLCVGRPTTTHLPARAVRPRLAERWSRCGRSFRRRSPPSSLMRPLRPQPRLRRRLTNARNAARRLYSRAAARSARTAAGPSVTEDNNAPNQRQ